MIEVRHLEQLPKRPPMAWVVFSNGRAVGAFPKESSAVAYAMQLRKARARHKAKA